MSADMTYQDCYKDAVLRLREAGVPESETDARVLLEFVCGTDRSYLLAHGDAPVEENDRERFFSLIEKRALRLPLQLLTGVQCFCGFDFTVNEHVLIPRQDTEILVEAVLKRLKPGMRLLDMCTGSGCILISLLAMCEGVQGTGVDISEEALQVARANGARLLPAERQPKWYQGDLFTALPDEEKYDVIVSNPPYIASGVIETLEPEVKNHEPRLALDGSEDGLLFYRRIVAESSTFLEEGGYLLFEIGYDQGEAVKHLMDAAGFTETAIVKDYAGLNRVVSGKKR